MVVRSRARLAVFLSAMFLFCTAIMGCKTSSSQLEHDYGQLSTSPHELDCVQNVYTGREAAYEQYIRSHLSRILAANRDKMPAPFRVEKFCVNILNDVYVNAAGRDNGQITFFLGPVRAFEYDADFAAILSHELAHIINSAEFLDVAPALAGDQDYLAIVAAIKADLVKLGKIDEQVFIKTLAPVTDSLGSAARSDVELYGKLLFYYLKRINDEPTKPDPYDQILNSPHRAAEDPDSEDFYRNSNLNLAMYAGPQMLGAVQFVRAHLLVNIPASQMAQFLVAEKQAVAAEQDRVFTIIASDTLERKKDSMERAKLGDQMGANWKEQSADEIGYEMYLRAGFAKEEFPAMFYKMRVYNDKMHGLSTPDITTFENAATCQRGSADHPDLCWRLLDLDREWHQHHTEYEKLTAGGTALNVFGNALPELKALYAKP